MKTHTIAIVSFVAAALAVAAILVTSRPSGQSVQPDGVGKPILPALLSRINEAASVKVQRGESTFTFIRTGSGWTIAEKDNYPVKAENIRALLIALSELKAVEAKTSKPDLYPKIGVQDPTGQPLAQPDPAAPDAQPPTEPALINITDSAGADLGSIIIGTQKWGTPPEVYIRRAGETQSWLAAGKLDVPWDTLAWVDRQIFNIPREKWKSVLVVHPDGETLTVAKTDPAQPDFTIESIPESREPTSPSAGDSLGSSFSSLTLDDVRSSAPIDPAILSASPRIAATTFDGLTINARIIEIDDKLWAVFEASAHQPDEQPEIAAQATELNTRLGGWAFAIPEFKSKAMLTRWTDVLKPVTAPATEAGPVIDGTTHDAADSQPTTPQIPAP